MDKADANGKTDLQVNNIFQMQKGGRLSGIDLIGEGEGEVSTQTRAGGVAGATPSSLRAFGLLRLRRVCWIRKAQKPCQTNNQLSLFDTACQPINGH